MEHPNPYQATSETTREPTSKNPLWRRAMASSLRVAGAIMIAIPLLAIGYSIYDTGLTDIANDLLAILVAISFYASLGGLFIFLGNRLASVGK